MSKDYSIVNDTAPKVYEMLNPIYDKGYNDGYNDGVLASPDASKYTIEDIQKVVDRIVKEECAGGYSSAQLSDIFGFVSPTTIFETYNLTRIMEKVAKYEEHLKNSVKVGDIVKTAGGFTAVVTKVNENLTCSIMYYDGDVSDNRNINTLTKTGRSLEYTMAEILEILEGLKEINNQ